MYTSHHKNPRVLRFGCQPLDPLTVHCILHLFLTLELPVLCSQIVISVISNILYNLGNLSENFLYHFSLGKLILWSTSSPGILSIKKIFLLTLLLIFCLKENSNLCSSSWPFTSSIRRPTFECHGIRLKHISLLLIRVIHQSSGQLSCFKYVASRLTVPSMHSILPDSDSNIYVDETSSKLDSSSVIFLSLIPSKLLNHMMILWSNKSLPITLIYLKLNFKTFTLQQTISI